MLYHESDKRLLQTISDAYIKNFDDMVDIIDDVIDKVESDLMPLVQQGAKYIPGI